MAGVFQVYPILGVKQAFGSEGSDSRFEEESRNLSHPISWQKSKLTLLETHSMVAEMEATDSCDVTHRWKVYTKAPLQNYLGLDRIHSS